MLQMFKLPMFKRVLLQLKLWHPKFELWNPKFELWQSLPIVPKVCIKSFHIADALLNA